MLNYSNISQIRKKNYTKINLDLYCINKEFDMKTIAIEELLPYMNEHPISEQSFIDCGFKRTDVSIEESDEDEPYYYYTFEFGDTYAPTLMSADNFTGVNIFNLTEDYKTWKTEGELQMLFMLFLKEEDENN